MRMLNVSRTRKRRVLDEGRCEMGWDLGEKDALCAKIEEMVCFKLDDLIGVPRTRGEV